MLRLAADSQSPVLLNSSSLLFYVFTIALLASRYIQLVSGKYKLLAYKRRFKCFNHNSLMNEFKPVPRSSCSVQFDARVHSISLKYLF